MEAGETKEEHVIYRQMMVQKKANMSTGTILKQSYSVKQIFILYQCLNRIKFCTMLMLKDTERQ